jgi:hypothetical protein
VQINRVLTTATRRYSAHVLGLGIKQVETNVDSSEDPMNRYIVLQSYKVIGLLPH